MRGVFGVLVAAAILLAGVAAPVHADGDQARYLVGYSAENEDAALLAIQAAGGVIVRTSDELNFAVVVTDDPQSFETLITMSPSVDYAERDDATRLDGAQWNGAQWNGAQWNGAEWNGAQWNGAQWNGAQWNDADLKDVSEAQRRAAKWTEYHYEATSDTKMKWAGDNTDPGLVWQWGPWATRAPDGWITGVTGTRTASICVLDSGVAREHGDIAPNFADEHNAMDPQLSAADDAGHGTHIASIAAGALGNAYGVAGAGNTRILSAKVLDANGAGHESDLAFGLVWCANRGADVAVMALSVTDADHPTLLRAIAYATQRDVLLLASAGNTGGSVQFPASHPDVMAVSAVDGNFTLASFSSRGAEIDLAAPGVYVLGAFTEDRFVFGSGTSQAVAYAAGVAALVRDTNPSWTSEQTWSHLTGTARDLGPAGHDAETGHGLVNVEAAIVG